MFLQEAGRISYIRRQACDPINKVQWTNSLLRLRRAQEIQKKRAKAKAVACTVRTGRASTSNRLMYDPECPRNKPNTVTVLAYGAAGSGAGTTPVAKSRRLQGSNIKVKAVNGGVVCVNQLCPTVRAGYPSRPRDSNAALNILLAMAPWPQYHYETVMGWAKVGRRWIWMLELMTVTMAAKTLPGQYYHTQDMSGCRVYQLLTPASMCRNIMRSALNRWVPYPLQSWQLPAVVF
ncbi:hypothetical protein KVV02_006850 [Mortierella alpina]|uniref:Uncharacterized protein n=1 Tax=Mortierella alpina TaxID=64518 RepID=A0A9P8AB18_MORAP|nr:hypothetical protein KVV02_006850 [Mortierella alpina]